MLATAAAPAPDSISVPDPDLAPLKDRAFLIDSLVEATGQLRALVIERLEKEERNIGWNVARAMEEWALKPGVWHEKLNDFYAQTDAFVFETLVWNLHPHKGELRKWIAEFIKRDHAGSARVLTYGDGLGIDSLYLAMAGHQVDYFEPSQACTGFAKKLGEKLSRSVRHLSTPAAIPQGQYDFVTCLDVLEHVPDPPALVKRLAGFLKVGGRLIVHAPFWYVHYSAATHLKSNQRYSGELKRLYYDNGLRLIDGRFRWSPIVLEKTGGRTTPLPFSRRLPLLAGQLVFLIARHWNWPLLVSAGHK